MHRLAVENVSKSSLVAVGAIFLGQVFCSTLLRDSFCIPKLLPLTLGAAILWLNIARRTDDKIKGSYALDLPIILLGLSMVMSSLFSIDKVVSLIGPHQAGFYGLFQFGLCVLLYYGVSYNDISTESITGAILFAAIPCAVLAVLQHFGHDGWLWFSVQNGRAGGTFGSPIYLGSFMAIVAPLAASWAWDAREVWKRFAGGLALAAVCFALLAARSRGGAVSAGVGIMVYRLCS